MSSARDDWYYLKAGESDQIGPVSFQEICILYKKMSLGALKGATYGRF